MTEEVTQVVKLAVVLAGFFPAALLLRRARNNSRSAGTVALCLIEIALGVADVIIGAGLVTEMTKPKYGEGGLLTLFMMLVGAVVCLVGLGLVLAATLQLRRSRAAGGLQGCLAIVLGLALGLFGLMLTRWLMQQR